MGTIVVNTGHEEPVILTGDGVLAELGHALAQLDMDRVVLVCSAEDVHVALGQVVGMLGNRVVAVIDEVGELPTSQAVFAAADVVATCEADGVLALGHPGPVELVKALPLVVDVPSAVISSTWPNNANESWAISDRGILTSGRQKQARPRLLCDDPLLKTHK